jgi:succinyl-CoA synthetase beta subunit
MKLLEYEAKEILRAANIPVPKSIVVHSPQDTIVLPVVLKSQVPTGGRGKAGGVKLVEDAEKLPSVIEDILSLQIKDFTPKVLLAEEVLDIRHEYYLSLLIDKSQAQIKLMAHKNGGVEVEENDPASFLTIELDGKNAESAGEQLAEYFDLLSQSFALQDMIEHLYGCFIKNDITLLEINPLVYTTDGKLIAGDCKMELDDAAAFRHPEWDFEDKPQNTNFVTLDPNGNVATIANGAGLAMATVDAVTDFGMTPANFLDIGGGASSDSVLAAFRQIMEYSQVKAIIINIFAGITRCDEVAKAIIEARRHIDNLPPLYIRLAGTTVELARELLGEQSIPLLPTLESCLAAAKQEVDRG